LTRRIAHCAPPALVDDEAARHRLHGGAEPDGLTWRWCLRLATPGHPFVATLHDAVEPPNLLILGCEAVDQHQRVHVPFPAPRQRQIGLGQLPRHHPQREDVVAIGSETEAAVLGRDSGRMQAGVKEVVEVLSRKRRGAVVLGCAGGEPPG
jgi:hypothetical protein